MSLYKKAQREQQELLGLCERCQQSRGANARFCGSTCAMKHRYENGYRSPTTNPEIARKANEGRARFYAANPESAQELSRQSSERMFARNPMKNPQTREKMKQTLKVINHKPAHRGGNGTGPSAAQARMHAALGPEWCLEYVIVTDDEARRVRCPNHYKIDIALPRLRIAVEVDGYSHQVLKRKEQDARKTAFLARIGWQLFRVSNHNEEQILSTISKCQEIARTSLAGL